MGTRLGLAAREYTTGSPVALHGLWPGYRGVGQVIGGSTVKNVASLFGSHNLYCHR